MFIVVIASAGLLGYITSPTFSLTISRLWYLFEMDLVNQPRGVSEPTHVVPIRPCHDVYSSLQCSHRHRQLRRHSVCLWPSYRVPVAAISCKSVYAYMYGYYDHYFNREICWDNGHVCACLCCLSSLTFVIVMFPLICVRYRYLILVDIWLISTSVVFLKIASGNW